jgi:hypothetical protein
MSGVFVDTNWLYPAHDLNVALLSNTELGAWEPHRAIHRLLTGSGVS